MLQNNYLIDTNILIYHTCGTTKIINFIENIIIRSSFNISILTKIEFLGWDKHTDENFEKCLRLIEIANVYPLDDDIANKAIELRRKKNIKIADAVIAATAIINNLVLATNNIEDFKDIKELRLSNPML
jgi:predicted nucleic acid-binding protein